MKTTNNITTYLQWALRPLFALLVGVAMVSCATSYEWHAPTSTDQAEMMLTISTPAPTKPTPLTRSIQTDAESRISKVRVLQFSHPGSWSTTQERDSWVLQKDVAGTRVQSVGNTTSFKAMLWAGDQPTKIIVLTNKAADALAEAFNDGRVRQGSTEAELRDAITISLDESGHVDSEPFIKSGDELPMYGEKVFESGLAGISGSISMPVVRAVARVDIVVDQPEGSVPFYIEDVHVFRPNNKIQVIPNVLISPDSAPKVTAPSIPSGTAFWHANSSVANWFYHLDGGSQGDINNMKSISQIYLPECATSDNKATGATTIVVYGYCSANPDGSPDANTHLRSGYYRIDFDSKLAGHPFGQILRNHRYLFRIVSVTSRGLSSPEEAAQSPYTSMRVEVTEWEDFASDLNLVGQRIGLSKRAVMLPYAAGRTDRIDVDSSVPYTIQWLSEEGTPESSATGLLRTTISNARFDARIVKDATDNANTSHISLRTHTDNHSALTSRAPDVLLVTAGDIKVNIFVGQESSKNYSTSAYNILSVNNQWGNLGDVMGTTGEGKAMRAMLDKHFSPSGTVKIAGFTFTRVPEDNYFIANDLSKPENMEIAQRTFRAQNVVFLPAFTKISAKMAEVVKKWLAADTHRVLIVAADDKYTNKEMLDLLKTDGEWKYDKHSEVATKSNGFMRGPDVNGTAPFFKGPFGDVPSGSSYSRMDDVCGYNTTYPPEVFSLIRGNKNDRAMFLGVNPRLRVVYLGDTHLVSKTPLSNDEGNVTSQLDKLMCNTWAWITAQVVYGDDKYTADFN